jgi:hypothetical protein
MGRKANMKKFYCFFMVSILALSFLAPFFLFAQEKKDGEEVYTIKKGDTLWDISSRFMKNPFLWPKLWQRNPYITNPHWIYPGNPVRLTPLEEPKMEEAKKEEPKKVVAAGEKSGEGVIESEVKKVEPPPEGIKTEASVEKKTPEQKPLVFPEIRSAGFFSDIDYRGIGYIVESREGKNYLSVGDICYVEFRDKGPVSIGERFTTFTSYQGFAAMDIRIGRRYNVTGVIQIIDKYGDFYTTRILEAFQEISKGDFIMPYNKEKMEVGLGTK